MDRGEEDGVEEKQERQQGGKKGVEKKEESKREREQRSRGGLVSRWRKFLSFFNDKQIESPSIQPLSGFCSHVNGVCGLPSIHHTAQ